MLAGVSSPGSMSTREPSSTTERRWPALPTAAAANVVNASSSAAVHILVLIQEAPLHVRLALSNGQPGPVVKAHTGRRPVRRER